MDSTKHRAKRHRSGKERQLIRLIKPNSEPEDDGSEHELSYYLNDRVRLMKEILKIIKPKKIRSMAPDCMKNLDNEEINSMLLEELLGISNKRLKYIFNGQNLNEESSSTDPEDQTVDVISLDDISDDDLIIDLDSDTESSKKNKKHKPKIKKEPKRKKVKKEKRDRETDIDKETAVENPMSEKNLMSVLELLELQARARAIKSQLALETTNVEVEKEVQEPAIEDSEEDDAVIVESPKNIEIVITSSESEDEKVNGDSSWRSPSKNKTRNNSQTKESSQEILTDNVISTTLSDTNDENAKITEETYNDSDSVKENKETERSESNCESEKKNNNEVQANPESESTDAGNVKNNPPNERVEIVEDTGESCSVNIEESSTDENNEQSKADNKKKIRKISFDDSESIVIDLEESEIDCLD